MGRKLVSVGSPARDPQTCTGMAWRGGARNPAGSCQCAIGSHILHLPSVWPCCPRRSTTGFSHRSCSRAFHPPPPRPPLDKAAGWACTSCTSMGVNLGSCSSRAGLCNGHPPVPSGSCRPLHSLLSKLLLTTDQHTPDCLSSS